MYVKPGRVSEECPDRCAAGLERRPSAGPAEAGLPTSKVPVHPSDTQSPKGNHALPFHMWLWSPEPKGWTIIKLHQSAL